MYPEADACPAARYPSEDPAVPDQACRWHLGRGAACRGTAGTGVTGRCRGFGGGTCTAHFYDAGHAFCNDSRPSVYHADAAATAWTRTFDFLREALA